MTINVAINNKPKWKFNFRVIDSPLIQRARRSLQSLPARVQAWRDRRFIQSLGLELEQHVDVQLEDIQAPMSKRMARCTAVTILKAIGYPEADKYTPRIWECCA